MKKWLSCLLVLTMLIPFTALSVSAEDVNFIPEASATFAGGVSPLAIILPIVGALIIAGAVVIVLKKKNKGEKA